MLLISQAARVLAKLKGCYKVAVNCFLSYNLVFPFCHRILQNSDLLDLYLTDVLE
jgi:hypothetical protein